MNSMNATTTERRALRKKALKLGKQLGLHLGVKFEEGDSLDNMIALLDANPAPTKRRGAPPKVFTMTKPGHDPVTVVGIAQVREQSGATYTVRHVSNRILAQQDVNGWRVTPAAGE